MSRFICNDDYIEQFNQYAEEILMKYGSSAQPAEREIMCMSDAGNKVAQKSYADLLFYKKIMRKNNYRDAFALYMESADLADDFSCGQKGYPLAFWSVAYYLVNYHKESFLKKCENIDIIENLSRKERLTLAIRLASSCVISIGSPACINLIGRILLEVSEDPDLLAEMAPTLGDGLKYLIRAILNPDINDEAKEFVNKLPDALADSMRNLANKLREISPVPEGHDAANVFALSAKAFFIAAANQGYVYSCNNLASKEAEQILQIIINAIENPVEANGIVASADASNPGHFECTAVNEELENHIDKLVHYFKTSADKYEPYAANRLGLFYLSGEVKSISTGKIVHFRSYSDSATAKKYFTKATVYPNTNSAWAFYNLIKYFHKDYTNDLDLLNEHMEYIRQLNPDVYNEAIEL